MNSAGDAHGNPARVWLGNLAENGGFKIDRF